MTIVLDCRVELEQVHMVAFRTIVEEGIVTVPFPVQLLYPVVVESDGLSVGDV
jgi:hypothetical protein